MQHTGHASLEYVLRKALLICNNASVRSIEIINGVSIKSDTESAPQR